MGHEADRIRLTRLLGEIRQARNAFAADPKTTRDLSHEWVLAQAHRWKQMLALTEAGFRSASEFHAMLYEQERWGTNAYAACQRLNSMNTNLAELRYIAGLVSAELAHYIAQVHDGPPALKAALDGIAELLEKQQEQHSNLMKVETFFELPPVSVHDVGPLIRQAIPAEHRELDLAIATNNFMQIALMLLALLIVLCKPKR